MNFLERWKFTHWRCLNRFLEVIGSVAVQSIPVTAPETPDYPENFSFQTDRNGHWIWSLRVKIHWTFFGLAKKNYQIICRQRKSLRRTHTYTTTSQSANLALIIVLRMLNRLEEDDRDAAELIQLHLSKIYTTRTPVFVSNRLAFCPSAKRTIRHQHNEYYTMETQKFDFFFQKSSKFEYWFLTKSWNHLSFVNISPTLVIDTSMEWSSLVLHHGNPEMWFFFQKVRNWRNWILSVLRDSVCREKNLHGFVNISPTLVIDTSTERSSRVLQHGNQKKIDFFLQKSSKFNSTCILTCAEELKSFK